MRIVQMLPSLAYGDAIGNDTVALKKSLRNRDMIQQYMQNI